MKKMVLAMMVVMVIAGTSFAIWEPVKVETGRETIGEYTLITYEVGIWTDEAYGATTVTDIKMRGLQGLTSGSTPLKSVDTDAANLNLGQEMYGPPSSPMVFFNDHTHLDTHLYGDAQFAPYCGLVWPQMTAQEALDNGIITSIPSGVQPEWLAWIPYEVAEGENPDDYIEFTAEVPPTGKVPRDNPYAAAKVPGAPIEMGGYAVETVATTLFTIADEAGWETTRQFGVSQVYWTAPDSLYAMRNGHESEMAGNEGDGNAVMNTLMFGQVVAIEDSTGAIVETGYVEGYYQNGEMANEETPRKEFFSYPVHVPEPSTIIMLIVGALCLVGVRLRRK